MQATSDLTFRYQYLNQDGRPISWRSYQGTLTQDSIQFKNGTVGYNAVLDSTTRDNRLVLMLDPQAINLEDFPKQLVQGNTLILHISRAKPLVLERYIDRMSSSCLAERHRQSLVQQGQGDAFRTCICPQCESTIDVSLLNKTPFVYCRFCETVSEDNGPAITDGEYYRLCDECGWFDHVQGYTEFYFYFLLVVYGFSSKRRHLCGTCMNRVFWRALLINLIFVLGIFPTLWMKLKGKAGENKAFKELSSGNTSGQKGKLDQAIAQYEIINSRYPGHPGVAYNQALSYFKAQDGQRGVECLQDSLKNCSNYSPSVRMINHLQERASATQ